MTFLWPAFEVVLVLLVVVGLFGLAAFFVIRRLVHRRWHRVRHHVVTRSVLAATASTANWREQSVAQQAPEALVDGPSTRVRRRLRHAVDAADDSVRQAQAAGAPVAELPAVCRSLRTVASELEAMLRLERRLPQRNTALRTQSAEVIRTAREVQAAAVGAMSEVTQPQLQAMVREARQEVEIVAAALQRMRSV